MPKPKMQKIRLRVSESQGHGPVGYRVTIDGRRIPVYFGKSSITSVTIEATKVGKVLVAVFAIKEKRYTVVPGFYVSGNPPDYMIKTIPKKYIGKLKKLLRGRGYPAPITFWDEVNYFLG